MRPCLITVFDYAWHVQSGSRDVINLFQQETDAWMSHTNTHKHTQWRTHALSGRQSQRHGVTETKPQKRRLALCDNTLTHIYIRGLACGSVPPSPPPAALAPPPPHPPPATPIAAIFHPVQPLFFTFNLSHKSPGGPIGGEDMALHDSVRRLASARFSGIS